MKKKIKSIVFDLDGTLMQSGSTIYKSVVLTLSEYNIHHTMSEEQFFTKIGHHFQDIFNDFKIAVPDLDAFINQYKSHYFDFIDETYLFENVHEVLAYLKSRKYFISLLTTKSQDQTDRIIDYFNLRNYFSAVIGRNKGIPVKPAPDSLLSICAVTKIPPEQTLMVGDTELDIQCGKNAGTLTCAVTFGYRSPEILAKEEPDFLISNIKEMINIVEDF
jgi:HAD superfamily hydrolase (TIGR01549 family)